MEITNYKNQNVIDEFSEKYSVSLEYSEICFSECIKFISLVKFSNLFIQPNVIVDDMWHIFITHTIDYREFCKKYIGSFVDHIPCDPNPTYYDNTIKLLNKNYGGVNEMWGISKTDVEKIVLNKITSKELLLTDKFASSSCYSGCGTSYGYGGNNSKSGCCLFVFIGMFSTFFSILALIFIFIF
jgi:hypothetical protein